MTQFLGWTATFLFIVMYIPQIQKMRAQRSVEGVSFWFLFIPVIANIIALVYATLIEQPPLQIKYILSLAFASWVLGMYVKIILSSPKARIQERQRESIPERSRRSA